MIALYFLRKIVRSDANLFSLSGWQGFQPLGVERSWKVVLSQGGLARNISINILLLVIFFKHTYVLSYDTLLVIYTTSVHYMHHPGFGSIFTRITDVMA